MIKEKTIKIGDGRSYEEGNVLKYERELTFKVRKMPAFQASEWVARMAGLMGSAASANGGTLEASIMVALGSDYDRVRPLALELLGCCSRVDAGVEQVCTPETVDGFVQDWETIMQLIKEAAEFNFSSSMGGILSSSPAEEPAQARSKRNTPIIKTSRASSGQ